MQDQKKLLLGSLSAATAAALGLAPVGAATTPKAVSSDLAGGRLEDAVVGVLRGIEWRA